MADDLHRIEFRAGSIDELRSYLDGVAVDFGCRPVARRSGSEYVVEAYAPLAEVGRLRSVRRVPGVTINVIENASEIGRASQAAVRSGNRFADRTPPTGLGIKDDAVTYPLNVDEIEAALDALALSNPAVTELITLPNRTSDGRRSHALRIGPPRRQG